MRQERKSIRMSSPAMGWVKEEGLHSRGCFSADVVEQRVWKPFWVVMLLWWRMWCCSTHHVKTRRRGLRQIKAAASEQIKINKTQKLAHKPNALAGHLVMFCCSFLLLFFLSLIRCWIEKHKILVSLTLPSTRPQDMLGLSLRTVMHMNSRMQTHEQTHARTQTQNAYKLCKSQMLFSRPLLCINDKKLRIY